MFKKMKIKKEIYIGKNLDFLLNEFNLDIKNLSAATGVPAPSISRLKKEGANPTISTLEPLLDFFRVDMKAFLYEDLSGPSYQNKKQLGNVIPIPIYLLEEIGKKSIQSSKVVKVIGASGINNANCFGISLNTDTLLPVFQKKSILIIDPDVETNEGDYVLCLLDQNEIPVFRKVLFDGKAVFFQPLNPSFGGLSQHDKYTILGVIIKSIETFR